MSVATDLQTIAANVPLVYAAGQRDGMDAFWEVFQDGGNRTNYQFAFAGDGFTEALFPPKYPISVTANNSGRQMFYLNHVVAKIEFPLSFSATTNSLVFGSATSLETISDLTVTANVNPDNWFSGCAALKNLTMHGTLGNSMTLAPCTQLSVASAKSVLSILSSSGSGKTLTFSSAIQSAVEADTEAASLIATARSNGWTIAWQ